MNETILNGLLNLFALFGSIVRTDADESLRAIHSYLSSHFGVRSHDEYIDLYKELREMYDDPFIPVNKEEVIRKVCAQMKMKLTSEEQFLLLIRFVEFANTNSDGFAQSLHLFHTVASIFSISEEEFSDIIAFIENGESPSLLRISGKAEEEGHGNFILREGMEGFVSVFVISRFDKTIFSYHGEELIFMNDIPLASGMFYTWQHSSVLKSPRFLPIYYSDIQTVLYNKEQRDYVSLTGRDLQFTFNNSGNGLHNFSFQIESGQLVAIMGGSGVGKSTLLSIMNGNLKPNSGEIRVNGQLLDSDEVKQLIGFVPQDDLLIEELTVYENLWYTARFCFEGLSKEALEERVDRVLKELDLQEIKSLPVGSPMHKTISGGQRKRLNIALELIREPAILYLDEPTSGLSSTDSEKVIMLLKEQTHHGRLVVVNIHQPSSEIYKLFDRLWLLDKGGYPIYDGNPIEAIIYFKNAANFTDQNISVCSTCGNINPELVLNIIDSKMIDDSGNATNIRKFTAEEWHNRYLTHRPKMPEVTNEPLPENQQHKPGALKQFLIYMERNLRRKLTNRQYLLIALLEAPLLALIVALLTRFVDDGEYTLYGNKNFVSYIFMSIIVVTFIGLSISAEEIFKDKLILKRERFLRLSRAGYLSSKIVFLFFLSGVQTLLYILVGNSIIEVGEGLFFTWWSMLWITAFLANLTGLILSQSLNSIVSIYITIPLLLIPQILLCGLVIDFDDLNTSAAKKNIVPLIGEVIPARWTYEALVVEQFRDNAFNAPFFYIEKEKFLAQYYESIHAKELRSMVKAPKGADSLDVKKTIENELIVLGEAARLEPRQANESPLDYIFRAEEALKARANNFSLLLDKRQQETIASLGGDDAYNQLRKENHNAAIEELVLNALTSRFYKISNHRIYPKVGAVYVTPDNRCGRSHFYSHVKKVGDNEYSTFYFNIIVLACFVVLALIAIFAEFPGRFFRE
ncbi:ATP-binding cassette domain-containing protein [Parabacteroides sp. OttesenSCG-928-N08]|nr:ATP-binding cassette domain-containing protein [Parabacteroides sp. OttesenSCG-928-N08]